MMARAWRLELAQGQRFLLALHHKLAPPQRLGRRMLLDFQKTVASPEPGAATQHTALDLNHPELA